jgi:hypothetical protein
VGSLTPRPTPNPEDQGVSLCLEPHPRPVRLGRPCYRRLSSRVHWNTQAPPPRQGGDTIGGVSRQCLASFHRLLSIILPALLLFLLQLSEWPNPGLNAIIPFLDAVVGAELEVAIEHPFPLQMLDVTFPSEYVTYLGSLTTPPCSEVVTWIVSSRLLALSHEQVRRRRQNGWGDSGSRVLHCWVAESSSERC